MSPRLALSRLSLNQITIEQCSLPEAIEVEVINREAWEWSGDDVFAEACEAFLAAA